jgi:hypothetical protein
VVVSTYEDAHGVVVDRKARHPTRSSFRRALRSSITF